MSVFTGYCCGTGQNRDDLTELLANLASRTSGVEGRDWMIFDGPGTAPGKTVDAKQKRLVKDEKDGVYKTLPPITAAQSRATDMNPIRGALFGTGWEDNVRRLIAAVENPIMSPSEINLVGWSRGGVTCHMMANALWKHPYLYVKPVNIFAIDPVPGPGNFGEDQTVIPPNVQKYHCIFADDERRAGIVDMTPTLPEISARVSEVVFYPLPGNHHFPLKGSPGLSDVAILTQNLVETFLTENGSRVTGWLSMSGNDVLETYSRIRIDRAAYFNYKGRAKPGSIREVRVGREGAVRMPLSPTMNGHKIFPDHPEYFITEQHRALFEARFPALYHYKFVSQLQLEREFDAAADDRALMKQCFPATFRSLYGREPRNLGTVDIVWTKDQFYKASEQGMSRFDHRYQALKDIDAALERYHGIPFGEFEARSQVLKRIYDLVTTQQRERPNSKRKAAMNTLKDQVEKAYLRVAQEWAASEGI